MADESGGWRGILKDISKKLGCVGKKASDDFSKINSNWPEILGDEVLERFCFPEYFRDGVLGVKVNSSSALNSLVMKKGEILARAQELVPSANIRGISAAR
ncbi:MAG TPA: hypothetical protein DCO86_04560 [Spirochaetaceae bacterium]|nr:hypothetical protein [Spirochaetaceae bacterium]